MWKYEQERNPWRYDPSLFQSLPLSTKQMHRRATEELKVANNLLELYKQNFEQYFYLKEQYKLKYAEQQLVENALDHKFTAETVLSKI